MPVPGAAPRRVRAAPTTPGAPSSPLTTWLLLRPSAPPAGPRRLLVWSRLRHPARAERSQVAPRRGPLARAAAACARQPIEAVGPRTTVFQTARPAIPRPPPPRPPRQSRSTKSPYGTSAAAQPSPGSPSGPHRDLDGSVARFRRLNAAPTPSSTVAPPPRSDQRSGSGMPIRAHAGFRSFGTAAVN